MKNNRGNKKNTFTRLIKTLFEFYPVLLPIIIALILFNSVVSSIPSIFMQNIIAVIEKYWRTKDWLHAKPEVLSFVTVLLILYILSLIASFTYNRLIAVVTQGSLMKFREKMFARMESLPIRYFDTNAHGDIMSIYTNDTDTLRATNKVYSQQQAMKPLVKEVKEGTQRQIQAVNSNSAAVTNSIKTVNNTIINNNNFCNNL